MSDPIGVFLLLGSIAAVTGLGVYADRSKPKTFAEKAPEPPKPEEPEAQQYNESPEQKASRDAECRQVLEALTPPVRTRKEWLMWVAKNHPDKGGDTVVFQKASNCFDRLYKSGGLRKKTFKARRRVKTNGRRTRHS
jgi:hypothetical protein